MAEIYSILNIAEDSISLLHVFDRSSIVVNVVFDMICMTGISTSETSLLSRDTFYRDGMEDTRFMFNSIGGVLKALRAKLKHFGCDRSKRMPTTYQIGVVAGATESTVSALRK